MATEADISSARSVWTSKDEAALRELTERRARIMAERQNAISDLLNGSGFNDEDAVTFLIEHAEDFRDALKPFDSRERT